MNEALCDFVSLLSPAPSSLPFFACNIRQTTLRSTNLLQSISRTSYVASSTSLSFHIIIEHHIAARIIRPKGQYQDDQQKLLTSKHAPKSGALSKFQKTQANPAMCEKVSCAPPPWKPKRACLNTTRTGPLRSFELSIERRFVPKIMRSFDHGARNAKTQGDGRCGVT